MIHFEPTNGRRRGREAQAGFTIVELLVASGITVVLATLLISVTSGMLDSWNKSRGRLTSSNQAKVALDQVAQDLEGLVLRSDGNVWLIATVSGNQTGQGDAGISDALYPNSGSSKNKPTSNSTVLSPAGLRLEDYRFGHVGVWLRFFTTEPAANDVAKINTVSTIRAVAYQIARVHLGATVGTGRRYFLYRSPVRPGPFDSDGNPLSEASGTRSTFTSGYDLAANVRYNNVDTADSSGDLEPGAIRKPDKTRIIASDVIDFGVRVYSLNSSGALIERFPVDRTAGTPVAQWAFLATTSTASVPTNPDTAPAGLASTPVRAMPAVVEVMIRVLTDRGTQLLVALETGKITPPGGLGNFDAYWWEIALANSQVFTRRIEIKGETL